MKLTAETRIASDRDTVWRFTQTPDLHARWDLRFTDIEYLPRAGDETQRFRYATRIGFGLAIEGWGTTVGERDRTASALRFGSSDRKSLILEGAGSWTYRDHDGLVTFSTVYDYATRYGVAGAVLDALLFRPLMIWATRWSFDRLRLWIEAGIRPELALRLWAVKVAARIALGLIWIHEGLVPKILAQQPREIALVADFGLYPGTAEGALALLGAFEIVIGLWLLSGRAERIASFISTAGVLTLGALAASVQPAALADPFGGISKNLALLACGLVVWTLSQSAPIARRARPRQPRRSTDRMESPFARLLRNDIHRAAPLVRAHFAPAAGIQRYEGVMSRVWRVEGVRRWLTAAFLWVGSSMDTLFPETGVDVPFTIVNRLIRSADGTTRMTFERTFHFPRVVRRFDATMFYDSEGDAVLDILGPRRHLLIELVPAIEDADGGITIRSRRQWLTPFGLPLRIRLPGFLIADATIRQWQASDASLGISVIISNRLLGPFFGYVGEFRRAAADGA